MKRVREDGSTAGWIMLLVLLGLVVVGGIVGWFIWSGSEAEIIEDSVTTLCQLPLNFTKPGIYYLCPQVLRYDVAEDANHRPNGIWVQTSHVNLVGDGTVLNVSDSSGLYGSTAILIQALDPNAVIYDVQINGVTVSSNGGTASTIDVASFEPARPLDRTGKLASFDWSAQTVTPTNFGISAKGVTQLIIDNVLVQNTITSGIYLFNVNSVLIRHTTFLDNFDPTGVNVAVALFPDGIITNLEVDSCHFQTTVDPPLVGGHPNAIGLHTGPLPLTHQHFHIHDTTFINMTSSINLWGAAGVLIERVQINVMGQNIYNCMQFGYNTLAFGDIGVYGLTIRDVQMKTFAVESYVDGIDLLVGDGALIEDVNIDVSSPQDLTFGCEPFCDGPLYIGLGAFSFNNVLVNKATIHGLTTVSTVVIDGPSSNVIFRETSISDGVYLVTTVGTPSGIVLDRCKLSGTSALAPSAQGIEVNAGQGNVFTENSFHFIANMSSIIISAGVKATVIENNKYLQCGTVPVTDNGSGTSNTGAIIVNV